MNPQTTMLDSLISLDTITKLLDSSENQLVEKSWGETTANRTDSYRDAKLREGLTKVLHDRINKLTQDNSSDAPSASLALIISRRLDSKVAVDELVQLLIQDISSLIKGLTLSSQPIASNLLQRIAVGLEALVSSPYHRVIYFPSATASEVKLALRQHRAAKDEVWIFHKKTYHGLHFLVIGLIAGLGTVLALESPSFIWIVPITASVYFYILNKLKKIR